MFSCRQAQVTLAGVAMLGMTACVPTRVTSFDPTLAVAQRTPPERIVFFDLKPPTCRFSEIGRMTTRSGPFTSWGRVVKKAREEASKIGGDAIVSVREVTQVSGAIITDATISATESTTFSGTVVRFTDPGCRE